MAGLSGAGYPWRVGSPADMRRSGFNVTNTVRFVGDDSAGGTRRSTEGIDSEQAHVPAEQPPSGQDAWLPAAHADQGRARGSGCAAAQGPGPGQRLTGPDKGKVKGASRGIPDEAAE